MTGKAITPAVLIELAKNKSFCAEFVQLAKRINSAPGVAYPCCNTAKQTLKARQYWDRILCSICRMSAARIARLKNVYLGGVANIFVRCNNNGRSELFVL
jgi:hypothetical protein